MKITGRERLLSLYFVQGEYRSLMAEEWIRGFKELEVPHTQQPNLISTLGDKVKIRSWQVRNQPTSQSNKTGCK